MSEEAAVADTDIVEVGAPGIVAAAVQVRVADTAAAVQVLVADTVAALEVARIVAVGFPQGVDTLGLEAEKCCFAQNQKDQGHCCTQTRSAATARWSQRLKLVGGPAEVADSSLLMEQAWTTFADSPQVELGKEKQVQVRELGPVSNQELPSRLERNGQTNLR